MNSRTHNRNAYQKKRIGTLNKQRGVALITALVITAVATTITTLIIYRQQIQIRLSSNISTLEQNYQYAYGMEDFAGTILKASFEDQPTFDSLEDSWYSETGIVLPIRGGTMSGKIHDLHARINVNALIRPRTLSEAQPPIKDPPEPPNYDYIRTVTKERLNRLIESIDLELEMGPAENFAVILKDWIDSDQENGNSMLPEIEGNDDIGNGAESDYYQSIEPAYYSGGTEMLSPTELRLLKNMKEKFYTEISKEVSTLPIFLSNDKQTKTPINVNTASEKVLRAIGFTPYITSEILRIRKDTPFESIESFTGAPEISTEIQTAGESDPDKINPLDLDVQSDYFLLEGKVEINNTRLFINSILWRNREKNGQVSVIMRDFSNPETIQKATE